MHTYVMSVKHMQKLHEFWKAVFLGEVDKHHLQPSISSSLVWKFRNVTNFAKIQLTPKRYR